VPQIQIGSNGATHVNAPFALLQELGIMDVFFIFRRSSPSSPMS